MKSKLLPKLLIMAAVLFTANSHAALRVFACEPEWKALAEVIAGSHVKAVSATNALQDPHYVQARPSLIASTRKADLLICSGADLEVGWLPLLLRKANNRKLQPGSPGFLMASDFVTRLDKATSLDRSRGDQHALGNPHIQTDPRNFIPVARELTRRLAQIDPYNAQGYQQGLSAFEAQWNEAIAQWEQRADPLRGKTVVLYHQSWVYLDSWLGLVEVATLENKPGVPPSGAHLNSLLAQLKENPAALIIRTPYQNPKPAEWLSKQTGIPQAVLPFTVGGSAEAHDLYGLFDSTINILLEKAGLSDEP